MIKTSAKLLLSFMIELTQTYSDEYSLSLSKKLESATQMLKSLSQMLKPNDLLLLIEARILHTLLTSNEAQS